MAGFFASHEFLKQYREHCARCKAKNFPPMDCETFYQVTVNGQKCLDWIGEPDKLDSSLVLNSAEPSPGQA